MGVEEDVAVVECAEPQVLGEAVIRARVVRLQQRIAAREADGSQLPTQRSGVNHVAGTFLLVLQR